MRKGAPEDAPSSSRSLPRSLNKRLAPSLRLGVDCRIGRALGLLAASASASSLLPRIRTDLLPPPCAMKPPFEPSDCMPSRHSPICSLRAGQICSLIWIRFDHRNMPAAAAPAAAAAAANGRSRALSITSRDILIVAGCGLLFWPPRLPRLPPRLLFCHIALLLYSLSALNAREAPAFRRNAQTAARRVGRRSNGQAVASWSSIFSALDARYSPGCSTLSCSTTPSLTIIE